MTKDKIKNYLIIALIVIIGGALCYLMGRHSTKNERDQSIDNLIAARDSVEQMTITINGLNNFVALKNAMILDQKEAIKAGILEKERLKALNLKEVVTNASLQATIKILRDSLQLKPGTIIITVKDTSGIAHDYVRIPFTLLDISEKYLTLNAGMNVNRTAYFGLSVPVSGTMTIGYRKDGFLKTKPVGVFTSENQYLHVNSMDILIVEEPKKFYQKTWFHLIIGGAIVETGHQLLKK